MTTETTTITRKTPAWKMTMSEWFNLRDPMNGTSYTDGGKRLEAMWLESVWMQVIKEPNEITTEVLGEAARHSLSETNVHYAFMERMNGNPEYQYAG